MGPPPVSPGRRSAPSWQPPDRAAETSAPSDGELVSNERLPQPLEDEVEADLERVRLPMRPLDHVLVLVAREVGVQIPANRLHESRHGLVVERDRGVGDLPEREPEDVA